MTGEYVLTEKGKRELGVGKFVLTEPYRSLHLRTYVLENEDKFRDRVADTSDINLDSEKRALVGELVHTREEAKITAEMIQEGSIGGKIASEHLQWLNSFNATMKDKVRKIITEEQYRREQRSLY